jgi:hypothetical protein
MYDWLDELLSDVDEEHRAVMRVRAMFVDAYTRIHTWEPTEHPRHNPRRPTSQQPKLRKDTP